MFNRSCRHNVQQSINLSDMVFVGTFCRQNAGKNCFVEQNVEQSINLSTNYACWTLQCPTRCWTKHIFVVGGFCRQMSNKAYICRQNMILFTNCPAKSIFLPAKVPAKKKALSTNICFVGQNVQQNIFLPAKVPAKICVCRTKCSTKHIFVVRCFCWGGVSCLATPCQGHPRNLPKRLYSFI